MRKVVCIEDSVKLTKLFYVLLFSWQCLSSLISGKCVYSHLHTITHLLCVLVKPIQWTHILRFLFNQNILVLKFELQRFIIFFFNIYTQAYCIFFFFLWKKNSPFAIWWEHRCLFDQWLNKMHQKHQLVVDTNTDEIIVLKQIKSTFLLRQVSWAGLL